MLYNVSGELRDDACIGYFLSFSHKSPLRKCIFLRRRHIIASSPLQGPTIVAVGNPSFEENTYSTILSHIVSFLPPYVFPYVESDAYRYQFSCLIRSLTGENRNYTNCETLVCQPCREKVARRGTCFGSLTYRYQLCQPSRRLYVFSLMQR